jgi:hypothetical protein
MFKKSRPYQEPELFNSISSRIGDRKLKILEDSEEWHNVFFREITSRIDENLFRVLYSDIGRPNAAIRQLVGMVILKEGHNWSDEQLFDECLFNLRVMWALGLTNMNDEVPVASTYYDFQSRLHKHLEQTDEDVLGLCFAKLTKEQCIRFKVDGKDVRMDSKLFNSNIARSTRLQLVIGVLQQFFKELPQEHWSLLAPADLEGLKRLSAKPAAQHTYPLSKAQKNDLLEELGGLALRLDTLFNDPRPATYPLLERLVNEQFEVDERGQSRPKDKDDIDGSSMQSPHDPDAAYRFKESGGKKQFIHGFSGNITETCAKEGLKLLTGPQTEPATAADNDFFPAAIENTEAISGKIKNGWTDGAFNSQDNVAYNKSRGEDEINWYLSKMQGAPGNFDFAYIADGQLLVTDRRTGETQIAFQTPKGRYRIKDESQKKGIRYIERKIVDNYFRRKEIEEQPDEIRLRRPNVESTIHHVFYTLDGNKSKYRGLIRNHRFVLCRCFWVNFRRICKFLGEQSAQKVQKTVDNTQQTLEKAKNQLFFAFSALCRLIARQFPNWNLSRSYAY